MKKPLTFICRQKIKFILHVFLEILQRYCKLIVLGTLGMPGYANQSDNINLQKTFAFICRKKINFTAMLFWRYCKDNADFLLWYFEHTWLHTPKMIVSTCRRLRCLSACQKYTSSFTSFLRYYILKNPAIWLANILAHNPRPRILSDLGIGWEISITILAFI